MSSSFYSIVHSLYVFQPYQSVTSTIKTQLSTSRQRKIVKSPNTVEEQCNVFYIETVPSTNPLIVLKEQCNVFYIETVPSTNQDCAIYKSSNSVEGTV